MWPYGETPPLEKCEQPDLKHPKAMLQNDICPQNSPEGGGFRLLAHRLKCPLYLVHDRLIATVQLISYVSSLINKQSDSVKKANFYAYISKLTKHKKVLHTV